MQPCLYLFTGISFAGKSVVARHLAEHLQIPRVDPDEVSHEQGLGLMGEFLTDAQWTDIHARAEARAAAHLQVGTSVVYDTTAFTRQQRDALRRLAARNGATTRLIFLDTPREIAFARWQANEQSLQRSRVHPDDFAMVADLFEPPTADEEPMRYAPTDEIEQWVTEHIVRDVA